MKNKNTLGGKIQFYRKKKKLTQEQLAEIVGLGHANTISKIENDLFYPRFEVLDKIAKTLNVSLDDLAVDYLKKYNDDFNDLSEQHYELFDNIDLSTYEVLKAFENTILIYDKLKNQEK